MAAWGAGLFESEQDTEVSGIICEEAGMEPGFDELTYEEKELKIKAFNDRLFDKLFDKYKNAGADFRLRGEKYYIVILVALAMTVGVNIKDEQKMHTQSIVRSAGLYKESILQMVEALEKYVNGVPYQFVSPEVIQTLPRSINPFRILNHFGPRFYEDNVPTPDPCILTCQRTGGWPWNCCDGCGKFGPQGPNNGKFKQCARCKKVCYCNCECQKLGWKHHKKVCAKLANVTSNSGDGHGNAAASASN